MDVKKVAQLARIHISSKDLESYTSQMNTICEFFKEIEEVETVGIEPLVTPVRNLAQLREDVVQQLITTDEIIKSAPDKSGHLFKVPPVV